MATKLGEVTIVQKKQDTNNKKDSQNTVVDEDKNMEVEEEPAKDTTNSINPNPVFGIMGPTNIIVRRLAQLLANGNIVTKIYVKDKYFQEISIVELYNFVLSVDIVLSCYDSSENIYKTLGIGVIRILPAGKGFVQMSVIDVNSSVEFNEQCNEKGIKYLESIILRYYYDINTITEIISHGSKELYDECANCFHLLTARNLYRGENVGNSCGLAIICLARSMSNLVSYLKYISSYKINEPHLCLNHLLQRCSNSPFVQDNFDFIIEKLRQPEAKFGITLGEMVYHASLYQTMNDAEPLTHANIVDLIDIVERKSLKDEDVGYLFENLHLFS